VSVVELSGIRARRGTVDVLRGIDLSIGEGDLVVVTGPSGSGKSTLARVVLGLMAPVAGTVRLGDRIASEADRVIVPSEDRGIGVVFQDLALWPHLTVHGNLAFCLPALSRADRDTRIDEMLRRVDLADKAGRRPGELSGGEQQRVAIARALVSKPALVIMDEPLSNLDVVLAGELLSLFRELLRERRAATMFVTHDPREAEALADRVAVIERGQVSQHGTWADLRARPATPFVERFVA
jgi:iron(III) transport system ATP-binding protein